MRKKKEHKEITRYSPTKEYGLTNPVVELRKKDKLVNVVPDTNSKSYFRIIFDNIFTFFNILMVAIAVLLLVVCGPEIISNLTYLFILIINTSIGIFQECRSKHALEKLKLLNMNKSIVIREETRVEIPSKDIVLDDIVYLQAGDQVPADCIILDDKIIEVNESLLTGESRAVKKTKDDVLYAGSYIISGSALTKADKVGVDTYLHSIEEKAKGFKKPKSKLIIALNSIIKTLAFIAIPLSLVVLWNELIRNGVNDATKWGGFTIVYMIPAGMVLLATIAMSVGVVNLSRKKVLTQDLYSVEALSRIDTICLDKTGTLTDGSMTVEDEIILDNDKNVYSIISAYLKSFETANQTSKALIAKYGTEKEYYPTSRTIEFSSARKYSVVEFENGETYILGATDYLTDDEDILLKSKEYAKNGLRVVMLAELKKFPKDENKVGKTHPVAMFIIRDNIRPEVRGAMEWFAENDVDIKVISGDNIGTVSYIAKQCGIKNWDKAVDLSTVPEDKFEEVVLENSIYGRVSPEQKAAIVDILQKHKHIVGMTGDGINDIVALKKADCSIALQNGAQATKNIANLVLMDSNFSNMKEAVFEGRRVVNNIQRSSTLFVMKDFLWLMLMILPLLFGVSHIYEPTVMTLVNIMITGIASFLLSVEPNKDRIKGSFVKNILGKALSSAVYMLFPVLCIFIYSFARYGIKDIASVEGAIKNLMPVASICISIAGFIIFYNLCKPFTKYRRWVFILVTALSGIILVLVPGFFLVPGTEFTPLVFKLVKEEGLSGMFIGLGNYIAQFFSKGVLYGWDATTRTYTTYYINLDGGIIIGVFSALSFGIYYLIDKYLSKLLNITMFKKNKEDE